MTIKKNAYKIIGLGLFISILIVACTYFFPALNTPMLLLLSSNGFFCFLTLFVYLWIEKSRTNKNPNVFLRRIMSGMFFKMILTALAAVVLVKILPKIAAGEIMISLSFYLIYLLLEVRLLLKSNN